MSCTWYLELVKDKCIIHIYENKWNLFSSFGVCSSSKSNLDLIFNEYWSCCISKNTWTNCVTNGNFKLHIILDYHLHNWMMIRCNEYVNNWMTIQCNEYVKYALTTLSYQCRSCYQYFMSTCVIIEKWRWIFIFCNLLKLLDRVSQSILSLCLKGP